jgi:hypothetical protein
MIKKVLSKVIYSFDIDLKPNIDLIVSDIQITRYYPFIENTLDNVKPGILYYIKEFEKFDKSLLNLTQEDISSIESQLTDMRRLSKELKDILSDEKKEFGFFNLCNQYPCDVEPLLASFTVQHTNFVLETEVVKRDNKILITVHSVFLEKMLEEIAENSFRVCGGAVRFNLTYEVKDPGFNLYIEQYHPYVEPEKPKKGGLAHNVQHFVEEFGGEFSDNRVESVTNGNNYIITLKFLQHEYSIED